MSFVETSNPVELKLTGKNLKGFLQGLITNNINSVSQEPVETFVLTPQGKIKHQITITEKEDHFTIHCTNDQSDLFAFFNLYAKLSGVKIEKFELQDTYDKEYFLNLLSQGKIDTNFIIQPSLLPSEVDDSLVDYKKGCYVGQEVVARMKYKQKNKKIIKVFEQPPEGAKVLLNIENYVIAKVPYEEQD